MDPQRLQELAQQTVHISEQGTYSLSFGTTVDLAQTISHAISGTVLYRPADFDRMHAAIARPNRPMVVHVTDESTGAAARRLVAEEGPGRVAALNFASGKNPGGGFLRGTKAQEEDLARCSALYRCLLTQPVYYDANRAEGPLYTDHIIYSPDVPFFRDERLELLEAPFLVSIITSPAPNAGEVLRREPNAKPMISMVLRRRASWILRVAVDKCCAVLALGAWGCGVFRNDPVEVAQVFADLLSGPYAGCFDRVVFAILDRSQDQRTLYAFQRVMATMRGL